MGIISSLKGFFESSPEEKFHDAGEKGNFLEIKNLIEKKVNINSKGKDGKTVLYKCCEKGVVEIVRLLLAKGADINEKDPDGNSPFL